VLPCVFGLAFGIAAVPAQSAPRRFGQPQESPTVPVPRRDKRWVQRQEHLNETVKKNQDAQLLFIGDSITHAWETDGKDVWEKFYAKRHAINLGIGGDQTQHVLWRLEHGNLEGLHPKLAVLMIGTNNSGRHKSAQIADGVKAIVDKLQAKVPECKVLILAIFPRGDKPDNKQRKVNEGANEIIAKLADDKKIFYLDIGSKFLAADATLPKDIMPDYLHPNAKGYEIWATAIEPTIVKLLGESS
jgi:lysophospholipase L1-like esterase